MPSHNFTLLLSQPNVDEETAADHLYGGSCDDALLSVSGGVYELEFDREAPSLKGAITSAIRDVRRANIGSRVLRVVPDDLANANTIAERSGKTRQAVALWVRGERGDGFPPPKTKVGASPVWSWLTVAQWLAARSEVTTKTVEDAATILEV
ncbi:MAG: hypothetical protein KC492_25950, partial [Myxococcales bacterium]|nr:hypothetical protein [Myxococcales bacterium]